jgi:hypothetical protein
MAERAEVSPPKIAVNPAGFSCAAVSVGDHLVRRGQRRCKTVMHARQIRALDPILAAGAGGDAEYPLDITDVLAAVGCKACGALADADVPAPPPRPRQIVVERCGAVDRGNRDLQVGGRGTLVGGRDGTA